MSTSTPFKTGKEALPRKSAGGEGSGIDWIRFEGETPIDMVPLANMDALISINQHALWRDGGGSPIFPCIRATGQVCPGCVMGDKAKYKAFLPVLVKDGGEFKLKFFAFGVSVAEQLNEIDEDSGSGIRGKVIRVRRTGAKLTTRYKVIVRDVPRLDAKTLDKFEVPDVTKALGPITTEDIEALLEAKEFPYEKPEPVKPEKAIKKGKPAAAKTEVVDEDPPIGDDTAADEEWSGI